MTTEFTKEQMAAFVEVATKRAEANCTVCDCIDCYQRRRDAIHEATKKELQRLTGGDVVRINGVWHQLLPGTRSINHGPVDRWTVVEMQGVTFKLSDPPAKTITHLDLTRRLTELSSQVKATMGDFCIFEAEADDDLVDSDWIDNADMRFKEAFSALRRAIHPSDNY